MQPPPSHQQPDYTGVADSLIERAVNLHSQYKEWEAATHMNDAEVRGHLDYFLTEQEILGRLANEIITSGNLYDSRLLGLRSTLKKNLNEISPQELTMLVRAPQNDLPSLRDMRKKLSEASPLELGVITRAAQRGLISFCDVSKKNPGMTTPRDIAESSSSRRKA
jgi:hypothetical protein